MKKNGCLEKKERFGWKPLLGNRAFVSWAVKNDFWSRRRAAWRAITAEDRLILLKRFS